MTAQTIRVGASFDNPDHWHGIRWAKCHQEVRRLQARIVKAIKEMKPAPAKGL